MSVAKPKLGHAASLFSDEKNTWPPHSQVKRLLSEHWFGYALASLFLLFVASTLVMRYLPNANPATTNLTLASHYMPHSDVKTIKAEDEHGKLIGTLIHMPDSKHNTEIQKQAPVPMVLGPKERKRLLHIISRN